MNITLLERCGIMNTAKYRVEGEPTAEAWRGKIDRHCVVTIHNGELVDDYTGGIWPDAWPDIFKPVTPTDAPPYFELSTSARLEFFKVHENQRRNA